MTSMLLTPRSTRLLLFRAVAFLVRELAAFLHRRFLDLGAEDVAHRFDPVGDEAPLLTVPLLDDRHRVAFVVLASHLDRPHHPLHAQLLDALFGEVQVLESPPYLLAGERLVPELAHRGPDRLRIQHRVDDRPVVEDLTDTRALFVEGAS